MLVAFHVIHPIVLSMNGYFFFFLIIYLAYTVTPCDGYDITSPVQDIYWLFFIGIELS